MTVIKLVRDIAREGQTHFKARLKKILEKSIMP